MDIGLYTGIRLWQGGVAKLMPLSVAVSDSVSPIGQQLCFLWANGGVE